MGGFVCCWACWCFPFVVPFFFGSSQHEEKPLEVQSQTMENLMRYQQTNEEINLESKLLWEWSDLTSWQISNKFERVLGGWIIVWNYTAFCQCQTKNGLEMEWEVVLMKTQIKVNISKQTFKLLAEKFCFERSTESEFNLP